LKYKYFIVFISETGLVDMCRLIVEIYTRKYDFIPLKYFLFH
jgi:hypothetical protein